jgi:hypothetical protein
MKTIPVSPAIFAVVDDTDWPVVSAHKWAVLYSGRNTYAQSTTHKGVLMHRLVAGLAPSDGKRVDHRDHNGLNNCRSNLRVATQSQNIANGRKRAGTQTPYKGVSTAGLKFRAEIRQRVNGKMQRHYLGLFPTAELAALAYDRAAIELYGEFACLNFSPTPAAQKAA